MVQQVQANVMALKARVQKCDLFHVKKNGEYTRNLTKAPDKVSILSGEDGKIKHF